MTENVRIGLLGCGNVGSGFVVLLERERRRIRDRYGVDVSIERILVRDPRRPRADVDPQLLTSDASAVIDTGCDIVVELIGGVHSAGAFVRRAIERGRHVVTANKALIASQGAELARAAASAGVGLAYEASVCAGVPVIRTLRHAFSGDRIESIRGVLSGTCNFVLSRMECGHSLDDAVRLAQARGFAEADPALDVDGIDAMQKLRILAGIAFDVPITSESVEGIGGVSREAVARARAGGAVIRLVAEARRNGGSVALHVAPRELDASEMLASVRDENNAVIIRGRASGEVVLTGAGAGAMPTAAAVLSDVIDLTAGVASRRARAVA